MDEIHVIGGNCLHGNITVQGSKNTVLPLMAGALLYRGINVLKACPRITDVFYMEEILRALGAETWWEDHDLYLDCTHADGSHVPEIYSGRMRSSIILLGPILARNQQAEIGYPGGCVIGKRPVDLHLYVLRRFGAEIKEEEKKITVSCKKLCGTEIVFSKRSVGATEQAILCATLSKGTTTLRNCAREPEIVWLCRFLNAMGAKIEGAGEDCICIEGTEKLCGTKMQIPADRIVTGTYICAAAATRGHIVIENAPEGELDAFLQVYRKMGGQYEWKSGKLIVNGQNIHCPVKLLKTDVYPGFPTDLQSQVMSVLTTVTGKSLIREQIFEDRYKAAGELVKMGAHINICGREAYIEGGYPLYGRQITARELRGGAALVIAALCAKGTTKISGYSFISRGYEHICQDLAGAGARISLGRATDSRGILEY